jgi:hypothetical protein
MIYAESTLLLLFLALGIYAQMERDAGLANPFQLNELHHLYFSAPAVLLGGAWAWVALLVGYDDFGQHFYQCFDMSPLHWLFGVTVWRWTFVRRVVAWLNARLGRKP